MGRRRAYVLLGCALSVAAGVIAACETFDEAPSVDVDGGGGADGPTSADAPVNDVIAATDATSDAALDAPSGVCDVIGGPSLVTADGIVGALAADNAHVYIGTSTGLARAPANGGVPAPVISGIGACSRVVLGGDYVVARFGTGSLRVKNKGAITDDASVPSQSGNAVGLDSRSASAFFVHRVDSTFTCPFVTTSCSQILDHVGVSAAAPGPSGGIDFMAAYGSTAGVFHCGANCDAPDSGTLLTTASQPSSKLATSDDDFVYFLDRTAKALRKIPRAGGPASDVITGLVEPIDVELDSMGRFVIATLANGVFRGPKAGCVAPANAPGATIGALAVSGTTVWYAEGASIKRVP